MSEDAPRHTEDLPLEPGGGDEREDRRVDQGPVTGQAGVSGTEATDFRPQEPDEEAEGGG